MGIPVPLSSVVFFESGLELVIKVFLNLGQPPKIVLK